MHKRRYTLKHYVYKNTNMETCKLHLTTVFFMITIVYDLVMAKCTLKVKTIQHTVCAYMTIYAIFIQFRSGIIEH